LQRGLTGYFSNWQFRHPRPADFFEAISSAAGQDLTWFFDQVYRSSNTFDYSVQDLQSISQDGLFHTTVVVRRVGEAIFPVTMRLTFADGQQVDEAWDGRGRWQLYSYDRPVRAKSA